VTELKAGSLAYYDSFSGLIKVRILSVKQSSGYPDHVRDCKMIVTGRSNRIYKQGESINLQGSLTSIVPRNIRFKRGSYGMKYFTPAFTLVSD
jgi:hypothetical protein